MNPKPYFGAFSNKWKITKACLPLMCEAFKTGTHSVTDVYGWKCNIKEARETFEGWVQYDEKTGLYRVRVSNDERRRLLPILKELL